MKAKKELGNVHNVINQFDLPKSISKALKQCVISHAQDAEQEPDQVKYLWLCLSPEEPLDSPEDSPREMSSEEWLDILDEAASLGAKCLLLCVKPPLANYPKVMSLCQWAQDVHNMMVGIFVYDGLLDEADLDQLVELDSERMCVFARQERLGDLSNVTERGLKLCSGSVTAEDHTPPCDLPETENMVCVGPEGNLYTCGLVLGSAKFNLGNALDKPLRSVVDDKSLPRRIPREVRQVRHGCDGCPPIMAKRVMELDKERGA